MLPLARATQGTDGSFLVHPSQNHPGDFVLSVRRNRNILHFPIRHGRGQYLMGTHPVFFAASVLARAADEPRVLGAANIAAGYLGALLRREPRSQGAEFRRQLRRFQPESLALGKTSAVARWEERQSASWHPDARSSSRAAAR